ncbi:MAG TPA: hypothetical protein VFH42_01375 [Sporolactobacillaceae bacterium]|nr:hypothetical protein [Sporolactobacillaceae bacterium]
MFQPPGQPPQAETAAEGTPAENGEAAAATQQQGAVQGPPQGPFQGPNWI